MVEKILTVIVSLAIVYGVVPLFGLMTREDIRKRNFDKYSKNKVAGTVIAAVVIFTMSYVLILTFLLA